MDARAQQRLVVLNHVLAGELGDAEAAQILGLSARHFGRLLERYRSVGAAALIHGNYAARSAGEILSSVHQAGSRRSDRV